MKPKHLCRPNCEDRRPGCQDHCEFYLGNKEKFEAEKQMIREAKARDTEADRFLADQANKRRKDWHLHKSQKHHRRPGRNSE